MKILIAVPSMDSVPAVFAQSLSMLQKVGDCAVAFQVGSLIYNARNQLAQQAVKMGADYVMWFDSDMQFEPDTLKKMLDTMQKNDLDILSGVYFRRVAPYAPVLFDKLDFTLEGKCIHHNMDEVPESLTEVAGIGFGCVLMDVQVLLDVIAKYKDAFSPIGRVGEDLSFCYRARSCGYKIWADPSIKLGHCSHTIVNREFYEAFQKGVNHDK